jgi:hypothetical protein
MQVPEETRTIVNTIVTACPSLAEDSPNIDSSILNTGQQMISGLDNWKISINTEIINTVQQLIYNQT